MGRADRAYIRRHERVRSARGKATLQICIGCSGSAAEWAQIHDTDGEFPEDYRPMCNRCHQKYDDKWNEVERAKVSASVKRVWDENPERRNFSEQHRAKLRAAWARRKARQGGDA